MSEDIKSVEVVSNPGALYGGDIVDQNNDHYAPCIQLRVSYRFNSTRSKYKGTGAGQDAKNRM